MGKDTKRDILKWHRRVKATKGRKPNRGRNRASKRRPM